MGNAQTRRNRSSVSSEQGSSLKNKLREHKRYGTVVVKITNIAPNRRPQDNVITHSITAKGGILYGSQCSPNTIQKALSTSGFPVLIPSEIALPDTRAHKILVAYCKGWYAIPSPEVFSRHSGTCLILGDRNITCVPYNIKVGDCFRLGSVGLVVSELKVPGRDEVRLDAKTLQFLKDEALAFDTQEDMATLAHDEENAAREEAADEEVVSQAASPVKDTAGIANGERFICYMCYETHNTDEDALVAPCECKGDTRYLHVQCLQKWYQSSVCGSQAQVIRTTGNGAPACKICGAAYKSAFRKADGKKASLLEMDSVGPYLSLVVVTKHDTNPGLFNTKFRLSFGRQPNTPASMTDEQANTLVIGRSSSCNMILDYRTVSTIHAQISYDNGSFYMTDKRSSNGTMVYLQDPIPLSYSTQLKFRMGRTTLSLQAKRGWTTTLRSALGVGSVIDDEDCPSAEDLHTVLTECRNSSLNKREPNEMEGNNNFMLIRQYTTRTNNDNSIDPHDVDNYMDGLRDSPLGGAGTRRGGLDREADESTIDRLAHHSHGRHPSEDREERGGAGGGLRATFLEEDEDLSRAIQESLLASGGSQGGGGGGGISLFEKDDDAATTMFEHQASTEALHTPGKGPLETRENSKKSGFSGAMRSPRKESPVVMFGEENNGGRSMTKLGTIVLSNTVDELPEKEIVNSSSNGAERIPSKEYLPAAGAFAVPSASKRASEAAPSSSSTNGGEDKSADVSSEN